MLHHLSSQVITGEVTTTLGVGEPFFTFHCTMPLTAVSSPAAKRSPGDFAIHET